jgi:hypothetical protein
MPPPTDLLAANPATALPGVALGVAQTVAGLINAGKTKKEAARLDKIRPKREISPLYGQNLSLAESELAGGMSQKAESAYNQALDRQQSGSLSAILRGGGDVNSVSDVFAAGEEGRQRLAMLTDELRLKQIDSVLKSRDVLAEEGDKNFIFNDYAPWADKSAANATARKDANAAIWGGLQTATGGITDMLGSGGKAASGGGEELPDGQSMWLAYKSQMERDNAAQGNYDVPSKFNTRGAPSYNYPNFNVGGLYNYLNRGI